jgi:hypothetical protein
VLGRKIGSKGVRLLIALAFLGPRPFGMEVRHLNGIATDNRLENLEYATRSRNIQDKKWHAGQKNYRLSVQSVRDIKRRLANTRITEVAREYGVSVSTIWNIKRNHIHRDVVP